MGLGSAFPCLSSIVQGKAAAERIVYTITRTPLIDSASDQGTKLASAKGEIELKVPSRHRSATFQRPWTLRGRAYQLSSFRTPLLHS